MENRNTIIEPFEGEWIAFYSGERYNRVTGPTPDAARALLRETVARNPGRQKPQSLRGFYIAGIALLLIGAAAASFSLKDTTFPANHIKWAHHEHHTHQR